MKHRIDELEIGEYDEGWEASYKYKDFNMVMKLEYDEVIDSIKQHFYKVIDYDIENRLYKGYIETKK